MIIGITDRQLYPNKDIYLSKISLFLKSDIDYLIIREKDLTTKQYSELIYIILEQNKCFKHKIIVHSHIEVAIKYGITRVHLPEYRLMEEQRNGLKYSYSIHPKTSNLDLIIDRGVFYLISPAFKTSCKPKAEPLKFELLMALKEKYKDKIVLLGGIDQGKVNRLNQYGFSHYAIRSGLEEFIF